MKTIAVTYVESASSRTYDYAVHPSVGEVKVGDKLYAEARDTVALVEVKAIHVIPSKYATKFAFQKVTVRSEDGSVVEKMDEALLANIRAERLAEKKN